MARIVLQLSRPARRRLLRMARQTRDAGLRTRIHIILQYAAGKGCDRTAEAVLVASGTAARVARRFLEEGEAGLVDRRVENGTPKVDDDLLVALAEFVGRSPEEFGWSRPTWTRELMARELKRRTGVEVAVSTIGRMLGCLGARWGMARPVVKCPWSKRRKERVLRGIRLVLKRLRPGELAFYEDELDVHLNPKIGRDWMLRAQQKQVLTPGKNEKRYLAGALSVDGTQLLYVWADRKNTDLFIALLEALRRAYPSARRIHLVLDNYVIHKSKRLKRWLAKQEGFFELHFLPPYTPEENAIERFWREVHANVTRNHRCSTMVRLMRKLEAYLRTEARRRRWQVRSAPFLRAAA